MSEPKAYSIESLATKLGFNKYYIKAALRKMNVNPDVPIEEVDAKALVSKMNKTWKAEWSE